MQTVDKTMKFVTSSIQGVRKWSEYRDQIPLVFEIFGKNSYVSQPGAYQFVTPYFLRALILAFLSDPGLSTNIKQQQHSKAI